MSQSARVSSLDAISTFRIALVKFAEAAYAALTDAESEIHRTMVWLETEQRTHWQAELRKRHDLVVRAKEAVRSKKLFKNAAGQYDSAIDEEKALAKALRKLEEAEQKSAAVKRWVPKLQKEVHLYKGLVQRLSTSVQSDLPLAIARLERIRAKLQEYVDLAPAQVERAMASPGLLDDIFSDQPSMARRGGEAMPEQDDEAKQESINSDSSQKEQA